MKIKNNSGVWLFVDKNGKFIRGYQIDKIQWGGRKYYRFMYSQNGEIKKKLYDTLNDAKDAMINQFSKQEEISLYK